MHRPTGIALVIAAALAAGSAPTVAAEQPLLTGQAAFGTWQDSAPGVRRLITRADLPPPYATPSETNAPGQIAMPASPPLKLPAGFHAELVAQGLKGPRVVRTAPNGDLFIADSSAGEILVLRLAGGANEVTDTNVFASDLNNPYGIAFYPPGPDPRWVYVGSSDGIVRFPYRNGDLSAAGTAQQVVGNIPANHHWTRDIAFAPDGKTLYLDVGSGSNIGEDASGSAPADIAAFAASHPLGDMWGAEEGRASVIAFDPDGKNRRIVATGLRNCSGLTIQPATDALWCVVNERDGLGDNLVPDYATHVEQGAYYGWPWYYIGSNEDPRSPLKGQRPDLAGKATIPDVLFQAHSAPLNIVFYDGAMFPAEYKGDAFVAMHGSWNRGQRTGYKIVRVVFKDGKPTGEYDDFMTGFVVSANDVWGRPVGVAVATDGALIVTDDAGGTVWRVTYNGSS